MLFRTPKTEVRRLFSKFFTANILFWEYLGVVCFRPKNQFFLLEKDPATLSHEQWTHSAKIVPIVWLEIAKMPSKISAQFVCPSPKVSNFWKKALSGCPLFVLGTMLYWERGFISPKISHGFLWDVGRGSCYLPLLYFWSLTLRCQMLFYVYWKNPRLVFKLGLNLWLPAKHITNLWKK